MLELGAEQGVFRYCVRIRRLELTNICPLKHTPRDQGRFQRSSRIWSETVEVNTDIRLARLDSLHAGWAIQCPCLTPLLLACLSSPAPTPHHHSPHNSPTPRTTINLRRRPQRQTHTATPEKRSLSTTVRAQIEVHVCAVLIRAGQAGLTAQRVTLGRAEVVDHDDDGGAGVGEGVAAAVCLAGEAPAGSAGWTGAEAWADAEARRGC